MVDVAGARCMNNFYTINGQHMSRPTSAARVTGQTGRAAPRRIPASAGNVSGAGQPHGDPADVSLWQVVAGCAMCGYCQRYQPCGSQEFMTSPLSGRSCRTT